MTDEPEYPGPWDDDARRAGFVYRPEVPARVELFFQRFIRHSIGQWAGKPGSLLDWQAVRIIRPLFGWVHADTGLRRHKRVSLWVAKKNGKTTLGAWIMLYLTMADGENAAKVYSAAVSRDQASLAHDEAIRTVEHSPALDSHLEINRTTRVIRHRASQSTYGVLSHEASSSHGLNIHGALLDEIHAWSRHDLWEALVYGCRSRSQPILMETSTAGIYDPESIGFQHYDYARKVQNGVTPDIRTLAVVLEAEPEDPWDDVASWRKANPSLGETVQIDDLRADATEARGNSRLELAFKRYTCNQWVSAEEVWIRPEDWAGCIDPQLSETDMAGLRLFAGLDLSSVDDMTALAVVALDAQDNLCIWPYVWCPQGTLARRQEQQVAPYASWAAAGHIRATPGDLVDYRAVRGFIIELWREFDLAEIAFDPYNAQQMAMELSDDIGCDMVQFNQTPRFYNEPARRFETLVRTRKIRCMDNPAMHWCVNNAILREDNAEHIMPAKRSRLLKIDPLVGAIMGLARCMFDQNQVVTLQGL